MEILRKAVAFPACWVLSIFFAPDPKYLGKIDQQYVLLADKHAQCWKTETMTNMTSPWPLGSTGAHRWITNYQERPTVRGGLWQREGRLR